MLENRLARRISLAGKWQLELDGQRGQIHVPGVWEMQGYPLDVQGPATYMREIDVPSNWEEARIFLRFDAVSYHADALVNGQPVGDHDGLWTAFEFDVTDAIRTGESNRIELRILKPSPREDGMYSFRDVLAGFLPYVATTFGGPWQDVHLTAHDDPAWTDVHITPDLETGQVEVQAAVDCASDSLVARAEIVDSEGQVVAHVQRTVRAGERNMSFSLVVENAATWSPESPALYHVRLLLKHEGRTLAETRRQFGFRKLHADGDQLLLNGKPVSLRGVLSWGWDPATLAPTPSEADIREEFRRVRELGFNLYKLCLYVPPPKLFEIADEEGMLLWLELPMWLQRMNDHLRKQIPIEYADILARVHHHPSIVIYSLGCELTAEMADLKLLDTLSTLARRETCDVLICDNSGSGEAYKGLSVDFADFNDYHFYCDLHYFVPLVDHFHRDWRPPRPWIFGEYCDSDDYRDPSELTINGERPYWRDLMGVHGRPDRWAYRDQEQRINALDLPFTDQQLMEIARRESFLVRKLILERTRARQAMGGYVITGLRDTPITTSGIFDDLGRAKFEADSFRMFNADVVLLLEQGRSRVWQHGGDRPAPVDLFNHVSGGAMSFRVVLANAGRELAGETLAWQLVGSGGAVIVSGSELVTASLKPGPPRDIARIDFDIPAVDEPQKWALEVNLDGAVRNRWGLWVYPSLPAWPDDLTRHDPAGSLPGLDEVREHDFGSRDDAILVTSVLTENVREFAMNGGRVILLQPGRGSLPVEAVPFWRESIKLLYDHPLLARFPHDGHADLQFYHLATDHAIDSEALKTTIPDAGRVTPVIRRLDARVFKLRDYLIEVDIGAGKLLASTLRFAGGMGDQVRGLEDNPAGRFLLHQMVAYMRKS